MSDKKDERRRENTVIAVVLSIILIATLVDIAFIVLTPTRFDSSVKLEKVSNSCVDSIDFLPPDKVVVGRHSCDFLDKSLYTEPILVIYDVHTGRIVTQNKGTMGRGNRVVSVLVVGNKIYQFLGNGEVRIWDTSLKGFDSKKLPGVESRLVYDPEKELILSSFSDFGTNRFVGYRPGTLERIENASNVSGLDYWNGYFYTSMVKSKNHTIYPAITRVSRDGVKTSTFLGSRFASILAYTHDDKGSILFIESGDSDTLKVTNIEGKFR